MILLLLLALLLLASPVQAARQTDGTTQCLFSASTLALSGYNKLSVSFWGYWNTQSTGFEMMADHGAGANKGWYYSPNSSTTNGTASFDNAGHSKTADWTRVSVAAWHHYVLTFDGTVTDNTAIPHVYVDNVDKTLIYAGATFATHDFGTLRLSLMARSCNSGASLFGAGRIAEVAIYGGILLSGSDVASLYNSGAGTAATNVQSGSLVYYWQLCGTADPETPTTGAVNMTVTGATAVAHPISGAGICGATAMVRTKKRINQE